MVKTKSKTSSTPKKWIAAYKEYFYQYGELPADTKALLEFKELPFVEFGKHFEDLEELQIALMLDYFKKAQVVLQKDKEFVQLQFKEQHLAFLYVLVETISEDQLFLRVFQRKMRMQPSIGIKLQMELQKLEISWAKMNGWRPDIFDQLQLDPKKGILMNHALSCIYFMLKDKSKDRQDTDAFIEKTTDLLFKLTDTSTLESMLDLGRFMFSRTKSHFSY